MIFSGHIHKLGNNIDTDLIIPGRYLHITSVDELKKHTFEDLDDSLPSRVQKGDILLAGENFGCGSSREHAPIVIKACGFSAVIASSFARIFFRNSVNIGLPVLTCRDMYGQTGDGDLVEIDTGTGTIRNLTNGAAWKNAPYPEFITDLIKAGGLVNFARDLLKAQK